MAKQWTAERMMDDVIKRNGFEAEVTIWFCEKAEQFNNFELSATELIYFYNVAMNQKKLKKGVDNSTGMW